MKPLGLKTVKFPGKLDYHPKRGSVNWWEVEMKTKNGTKRSRREQSFSQLKKSL